MRTTLFPSRIHRRAPGMGRVVWLWVFVALVWGGAMDLGSAEPRAGVGTSGYAVPAPGRRFEFPRDHGSHPEFRIEWWYITGHLWDEDRERYGFQATFFRTAGPREAGAGGGEGRAADGAFGTDQLFLSHHALLSVKTGRFLHQERLNREGWAAGAALDTLRVWNGGSSLVLTQGQGGEFMRLRASVRAEASWDLRLVPAKPWVVFGTNGVSRKGALPEAASHYLTCPRLEVEGRLTVGGRERVVRGRAWMDHEFSSSQLTPDQAGWDWLSIQLDEGREIMAYRMRRKDGTTDPFSTLAWVDREGRVTHLPASAFELQPRARWRSPVSGAEYPMGLTLRTTDPATGAPVEFGILPLAEAQELPGRIGNVPYWEGACRVVDVRGGEVGSAFVELTGYAGDLAGRLK